jgi:multiple antibiotic resistance protein
MHRGIMRFWTFSLQIASRIGLTSLGDWTRAGALPVYEIGVGALALFAFPLLAHAQSLAPEIPAPYVPSFEQLATYVFVMLGPVKVLAPFAAMTRGMEQSTLRKLALIGTLLSLGALAAAAIIGVSTLEKWGVSPAALQMTGGIIIFLVALKPILAQFAPPAASAATPIDVVEKPTGLSLVRLSMNGLVFPTIVTPQGIALVILVLTAQPALGARMVAAVVTVMAINLVVMLLARSILKMPGVRLALTVFGNILGVLQAALGVQIVIGALRMIGVLKRLS